MSLACNGWDYLVPARERNLALLSVPNPTQHPARLGRVLAFPARLPHRQRSKSPLACNRWDCLLHTLLTLGQANREIQLFSQFQTQLDILEDWAEVLHPWLVCRIDGGVKAVFRDVVYCILTPFTITRLNSYATRRPANLAAGY